MHVCQVTDPLMQATAAPVIESTSHSTPLRLPFWETQMTPHGHHSASRLDLPSTQQTPAMPTVTPATEVNALGQPLAAQQVTAVAVAVITDASQRLAAEQATPAASSSGSVQRPAAESAAPRSADAASDADSVTPPGGFQTGQVWVNNVFSPEIPAERPR